VYRDVFRRKTFFPWESSDLTSLLVSYLIHWLNETKNNIKIVLLISGHLNQMQKVNKQKRIEKQSAREHIIM